jgi:hypothetical protein
MLLNFKSVAATILALLCAMPSLLEQIKPEERKLAVYDDAEGYAVLSVLLKSEGEGHDRPPLRNFPRTVKQGLTSSEGISDSCRNSLPQDFGSALKDFESRNQTQFRFDSRFSLQRPYEFRRELERVELPTPAPGEQEMAAETIGTLLLRSAVGFNDSRTRAVVYFAAYCGPMCYGGDFRLLQKTKNGWQEIKGSPICQTMS